MTLSMGLVCAAVLAANPFKGVWITDAEMAALTPKRVYARQLERKNLPPPDPKVQNRHILFRKAFELGAVKSAKVRITADDYYKLYVNGAFVGQGPASGSPDHTYFNEIDVTAALRPGRNVLAVHTYYQGLVNRVWMSGDNRHGMVLDLVADGRTVVASDESFKTARHGAYSAMGKAGYDTQYLERYDAGAKEVGFERPDFDDANWAPAVRHPLAKDYAFYPQPTPMLAFERIRPVSCERLPNGGCRLDFGGIYVGAAVFAAQGPRGAEVEIRCGQELAPDGSVRHKLRANCDYVEKFVLSGKGRDVLDPYDYKSFRYCELVPSGGAEIDFGSVVFVARHMPFALKAKPTFADPAFEPIWKLCTDTFRYGVQEQIQDCMEREKGYYLGDGCYTMLTYCRLTGDWSGARRFIDDFLRTAAIERGLVTCGGCSFMQEIAEYPLMFVWFARQYLEATGDDDFVRARYEKFADILACYRARYARADGLLVNLDKWCVVEWPRNFQDGYDADIGEGKVCTAMHNVINAWYIRAVKDLNAVADRLGKPRVAEVRPLEAAFRRTFYDATRHLFVDREGSSHVSLPGNVYAAFAELASEAETAAHHAAFVRLVREKRYSSISLFQFFPLFSWLREHDEKPLMDELILSPDAWLRNLREGATRTFEGWGRTTKWNTSLFHLTIASVAWFLCEPAGNPVLPGWYADPQIRRYGETYWIYPTYSHAFKDQVFFDAFSSRDLKTWTKHEKILTTNAVAWARGALWAPDAHEKDGKYYLFFGANDAYPVGGKRVDGDPQAEPGISHYGGIGVAVADRPEGPYRDLIGKPLVDRFWNAAQPIDQYVFCHEGDWYMVYGGWGRCNLVRLAPDFKSLVPFPDGKMWRDFTPKGYVEGSVMFERKGTWYFMYSSGNWTADSYCVNYSMAKSPFGPFEFKGKVLSSQRPLATGAGHHSVVNIPGTDDWYICYHRRPIPSLSPHHRVTCLDRLLFNADGTIRPVVMTE